MLAGVLIGLGSITVLPATVAAWMDSTVTDTDRYVDTVAPLVDDPAVQRAVTDRVTAELVAATDVAGVVEDIADRLAAQGARQQVTSTLTGLADPIAGGVESWVHDHVGTVVAGDRFAAAWVRANRAAHVEVVALMTGENGDGAVQAESDSVTLDLAPVITAAKERLASAGFERAANLPVVDAEVVLFQSDDITTAQRWFDVIDRLSTWLIAVAVALISAGVLVARGRRRALTAAGIGAALAMLALGIVLTIARPLYLDALPPTVDAGAAGAVFDQVMSPLRTMLRMVLAVGVVVALIAYLTGPSARAAALRGSASTAASRLGRGRWQDAAAAVWLRRNKRPAQIAVVSVAVLVFVFWDYPSAGVVGGIVLVAGALLAAVELVTGPRPPAPMPSERS
ncbi:hypothetical protein CLV30_109114 [Haloactinopolyspora alba]|uniref:Integral membrane protein n=1 Tax=Haloactinopolyspora alba TaxID=648780 RepID=A0A2P8E012_9ACTN|nr:hypothetical protein CLV30_109114 [Haloactinopolyspora alba]